MPGVGVSPFDCAGWNEGRPSTRARDWACSRALTCAIFLCFVFLRQRKSFLRWRICSLHIETARSALFYYALFLQKEGVIHIHLSLLPV
jgi:hypothetical protein